jgi:hypothetical protein
MNTIQLHNMKIASGGLAVTPGAGALSIPGLGLVAAVAGTATINTGRGQIGLVLPLAAGIPVYIEHTHVTAATATGIVSLH